MYRRMTAVVVVAALAAASCGGGADSDGSADAVDDPTATSVSDPTLTPDAPTPTPGPTDAPTTTPTPTPEPTTTAPTPTPVDLPGEPFDYLTPTDGELVGVIGVSFDDILEVHIVPGELSQLVGELPNLAIVEGTGEGRLLPRSIWWKIRYEGIEGWAGSGFLARIGGTDDVTSQVVAANGGTYLQAETMLDLGLAVADQRKSVEPASRVVVSIAPDTSGDLGEITIDIVGLGDDAQRGERLTIFGDSTDMGGEGFALKSVERTMLCSRGVTTDGICV